MNCGSAKDNWPDVAKCQSKIAHACQEWLKGANVVFLVDVIRVKLFCQKGCLMLQGSPDIGS